ncbi:MAG: VWA domain-containing protein [Deltaproteobacteria bacterium]|nr:VWA domain-containing protein [Deltaproteobacteria bacterium]
MAADRGDTGDAREERLRRWRLVLGGAEADGTELQLSGEDRGMDRALGALYDPDRDGRLHPSSPYVARWLGDIRRYFPGSVVQVMQRDAIERLDLTRLLLDPELLEAVEPDVHLVATLLSLSELMPDETRATARRVVRRVVEQLERELRQPFVQSVRGAVDRAARRRRPRGGDIDWDRTIRANLRHWQPAHQTLIVEKLVGFGRKRSALRDVVLCVDQSGSMASSIVYASVFAAALASMTALQTRLVVFDTAVVDLSEDLHDPLDLLFGVQLGGGTDIAKALAYCEGWIQRPARTVLVLLSDLFEGKAREGMIARAGALVELGVTLIGLLALDDEGAPAYDTRAARSLAGMGIPVFACSPDQFAGLMAAAIEGRDLGLWMGREGIVGVGP